MSKTGKTSQIVEKDYKATKEEIEGLSTIIILQIVFY
jgi:hypothetical protein